MNKHLALALQVAEKSNERYRHGAVVVNNGRVVGLGFNRNLSSPHESSWRACSRHAEIEAVSRAGRAARGATVYVARIGRTGLPRNSAPCQRCTGALSRLGISKIIYTEGVA